jgi:SAM-dependent methyltransferase
MAVKIMLPKFGELDKFCADYAAAHAPAGSTKSLDLGCGDVPRNPFKAQHLYGVDICDRPELNVRHADLAVGPIPFADDFFDFITAYDFIEHIPRVLYLPERRFPFVALMDEIWRCLKPGGVFLSHTPAYPYPQAFRDPTHVNIITEETFPIYFDERGRLAGMYGFKGSFEIIKQGWSWIHLISVMKKVA